VKVGTVFVVLQNLLGLIAGIFSEFYLEFPMNCSWKLQGIVAEICREFARSCSWKFAMNCSWNLKGIVAGICREL
jgi:hypothetical protein